MSQIVVDIADFVVSADPQGVLVTHALGSCIAVMVHDPQRQVAGMIHFMLPSSTTAPDKAATRPAMFADTGIPRLFHAMYDQGCDRRALVVKVAGGGTLHDDNGLFDIGRRNHTMVRKMFWKTGILVAAEDVGGSHWRTTRLWVGSGRCTVTSENHELEL